MPASSFRIKVCGVTSVADACVAVSAGADAIGLNFYAGSRRHVDANDALIISTSARATAEEADSRVRVVGVFVNADASLVRDHVDNGIISSIQLHGDEPPDALGQLPQCAIIRARRMDDRGVTGIAEDLEACRDTGRGADAVLVDAMTLGHYGGTGKTVSWSNLTGYRELFERRGLGDVPLILAGGLTPDNVAEAIRIVRPAGVDVASGVEKSPGVKDHGKIRAFVEAARSALE